MPPSLRLVSPWRHPELPDDYVFIGNHDQASYGRLKYKNMFRGIRAFDDECNEIDTSVANEQCRLFPVFVRKTEYDAKMNVLHFGKGTPRPFAR